MPRSSDAVRIEGLRELQRSLKAIQPDARREITRTLKDSARDVSRAAGPLAAHSSGRLSQSFKPGASMMQGYVKSRLPYAAVQEFGGTIRPKGAPVEIQPHPAATRALEMQQDSIIDKIGDALERVASRHGWN
jgi:phage gpG-like protein